MWHCGLLARGLGALSVGLALLSPLAACGPRMGGPAPLVMGASPWPGFSAPARPEPQPAQIRVETGDTLYSLARTYHLATSALVAANHLEPPYRLEAGSLLVIPPEGTQAPSPVALAALPQPQPEGVKKVPHPPVSAPRETAAAPPPQAPARKPALRPPARIAAASPQKPPRPAPETGWTNPPGTAAEKAPLRSGAPPAPPARPEALAKPASPTQGGSFLWPVRGHVISGFGPGPDGTHNEGINIAAPRGAPVEATAGGVVVYAGNELRGYGNLILIKHQEGWISAYAHLDVILVKRGQRVSGGQVIARVGATGSVSAPQLHFELRRADRAVDPLKFLAPRSTAATSSRPRRG